MAETRHRAWFGRGSETLAQGLHGFERGRDTGIAIDVISPSRCVRSLVGGVAGAGNRGRGSVECLFRRRAGRRLLSRSLPQGVMMLPAIWFLSLSEFDRSARPDRGSHAMRQHDNGFMVSLARPE